MAKSTGAKLKSVAAAGSQAANAAVVSPLSKELVVGVVGFAGSGCTTAVNRLRIQLEVAGYTVKVVKLSDLIARQFPKSPVPGIEDGVREGPTRFARAEFLQNLGDTLRERHGHHAVAALAVRKVKELRGAAQAGETKLAFILDSIKHSEEVVLLRRVYDLSFRLVAVHCEDGNRERRLIGGAVTLAKYRGVPVADVSRYMDRDAKDAGRKHGQQVRDAFYLADFFIDNNIASQGGEHLNSDLHRFCNLILGTGLVRPTQGERAMFHAFAAGHQSACLSRQVGAALVADDGTIVSTGANDPPRFGGGVYDEDNEPDHRCFAWEWTDGKLRFTGCHNQRKKMGLRNEIALWMAEKLSADLALAAHPRPETGSDVAEAARTKAEEKIREMLSLRSELMADMPGVKDIIEYSRSIHAEMNTLFSAARKGIPTAGTTLYCTVYPCHNCARHMVTAGVRRVHYIEPYVKSLATELHYDAISTQLPAKSDGRTAEQTHMVVVPFTGVGPRMYEDLFQKRGELKSREGSYERPPGGLPEHAVRLRDLSGVEEAVAMLMPETQDA